MNAMFRGLENLLRRVPPAAFLLWLAFLAYGVTIPWLGLYSDDWPFLYVYDAAGVKGVADFLAWSRPLGGWLYGLIVAPFGKQFWAFHLALLLLRWADALLLRRVLLKAAPSAGWSATAAAALFLVFPAFKQQPLPVEYLAHFSMLAAFLLSLLFMLRGLQGGRAAWLFLALAWLLSFHVFFIEYFAGLEALRPLLLWWALRGVEPNPRRRLQRALALWLPYLGVLAAFALWRVALHPFVGYEPVLLQTLRTDPLQGLGMLLRSAVGDTWTVLVLTWAQAAALPAGTRLRLLWLAAAGMAFFSAFAWLMWSGRGGGEERPSLRPRLALCGLGLLALLVSGAPQWVPQIPVRLDFPWDRSTLPFLPGAGLLTAGLLSLLPWRRARHAVLALLLALSVGVHLQNANTYRKEWDLFTRFFWQLTWRMPGLQPGTLLSLDEPPFAYHVDKFMAPVLNWTYAPQGAALRLPYLFYDFYKLRQKYPGLAPGTEVAWSYGNLSFRGSLNHMVLLSYSPPGCLQVMTPAEGSQRLGSPGFHDALGLSDPGMIQAQAQPAARPPAFLGAEPLHDWCFYYEKMDLARQTGNWEEAAGLADEALSAGLLPAYPGEWLLPLEVYARAGRMDAAHAAAQYLEGQEFFRNAVCEAWQRAGAACP